MSIATAIRPTGRERFFGEEEVIVSKTDVRGVITYANRVFVRVAGYSEEELLGRPHNIVRHPAMPRCVFKLLWDKLHNQATAVMAGKSQALAAHERRRLALADDLEANVGAIVATLAESAASLWSNAEQLVSLAQDAMCAAGEGQAAAGAAAKHVRYVDAVGSSLSETEQAVADRVQQSRKVAGGAVQEATRTAELMRQLSTANERIGEVVALISEIAGQTNLLSLNASIEAARAGDAGRGFAVVAREVLKLAEGTASATKRITKEVAAVQAASNDTASAIGTIETTIRQINSLAGEMDAAVREQLVVTLDVQRRLRETNDCVGKAASSIAHAGEAADRTNQTAEQLLASADQVSRQTGTLNVAVKTFLAHIRGGPAEADRAED